MQRLTVSLVLATAAVAAATGAAWGGVADPGTVAAARQKVFFPSRCANAVYRPRRVIIACGDGNLFVTRIHWRRWNRSSAVGRGSGHANDCTPNCAEGHFHTYKIRLGVYRRHFCAGSGKLQYTRLNYRFVGSHRPSFHGANRIRFPCDAF